MSKKTLYILIIIILIIAGIFVATKIADKDATKPVVANTVNNTNKTNNKNDVEENNIVTIENEIQDNNIENNITNSEIKNENTNISPEEEAKQIVKEHWGEDDDTVYYSYDGINEQGKYVICVRDKETTKALYRYYVNVEAGTCEIE